MKSITRKQAIASIGAGAAAVAGLGLAGCGSSGPAAATSAASDEKLIVFAAASMTESLTKATESFSKDAGTEEDPDSGRCRVRRLHLRRTKADEPARCHRRPRGQHRGP